MFASGLSKGILGTSVAVGTGVGLGSAALTSKGSNPFSKIEKINSSSEISPPKGCKLYKIWSSDSGEVRKTTEEEIKKELQEKSEYYENIKRACDSAEGGNVFLSKRKPDRERWNYYPEDQNKETVKRYLENNSGSLS
nr:hypothetical protein [Mycoplasma haemocanis]